MRIALFSPLSPLKTAVADHVEGLLPYLAEFADVDLYIDDGYVPNSPAVVGRLAVHSYREFPALAKGYDVIIYHMGNEPTFHGYIFRMLQKYRGIVVLHDLVLHHCILGLTLAKGDVEGYLNEMRYAYGKEGEVVAAQIMSGRGLELQYRYPLMERVLDNNRGVIVHNGYARQQLLNRRPGLNVAHIGQHFFLPEGVAPGPDGHVLREQLGLQDRLVVGTYGLLIPDKRLSVALRAFARFRRNHPQAVYLLVGPVGQEHDLMSLVQSLELQDAVRMTGWQDPASFVRHMCVADLAVHLKYPHVGGTPYTPIRLLGLGVPTIISDIEPLAEIPADCCARVDPEGNEEEELLATLEYLATHEETRRQMAENGRRYIQAEHNPRKIAQEYQRFIEATLSGQPAGVSRGRPAAGRSAPAGARPEREWQQRLIEDVGAVLADWGVQADQEHLLRPIAEAIAGLKLGPQGGDA